MKYFRKIDGQYVEKDPNDDGLPKVNGASDLQDSAALAGIMRVFDWPQIIQLLWYVQIIGNNAKYVRHPDEQIYNFSRDQAICLMAGLSRQEPSMVKQEFIDGRDIIPPSVKGHIRRCQGRQANWFQDLWLWAEVYFHAKFTPLGEPNQLLCMMMVADVKFLKAWVKWNPQWQESIRVYWCTDAGSWRCEPELAAHMIRKIQERVA